MKKITWDGIEYDSVEILAESLGINKKTVYQRRARGKTGDDDMGTVGSKKPIVWNGIEYDSMAEAARAVSTEGKTITRQGMAYRISKGQTCDADVIIGRPKFK